MRFRNVAGLCTVFALLLALPALASAQGSAATPGEMSYGVKAGINISSLSFDFGDASITGDGRAGFLAGLWAARDFNPRGGLQIEGLFSQKGTEVNASEQLFSDDASIRVSYIEIPVLGRFNFPTSGVIVRALAGPTFAFHVNEQVKVGGVKLDADEVPIKTFEAGFAIAGAVEVRKFIVDARYTWGLTDINDGTGTDEPTVKNGTFSISFGYRFK